MLELYFIDEILMVFVDGEFEEFVVVVVVRVMV